MANGKTVTLTGASLSGTDAGNYVLDSVATTTANINKADATVVVTAYSVTYNGSPHTATVVSITGVNGEVGVTVGTVDVSDTTHTNAGTYNNDPWSFTGTANYNNQAARRSAITSTRRTRHLRSTAYSVTYNGNPHTATVLDDHRRERRDRSDSGRG